mmetsp:Transcript_21276/g.31661  ORF Transcript_21276/g.31661 Transcript_21276/m.31661 type:complete len:254 (-) Transcript_21276:671-1432(-)
MMLSKFGNGEFTQSGVERANEFLSLGILVIHLKSEYVVKTTTIDDSKLERLESRVKVLVDDFRLEDGRFDFGVALTSRDLDKRISFSKTTKVHTRKLASAHLEIVGWGFWYWLTSVRDLLERGDTQHTRVTVCHLTLLFLIDEWDLRILGGEILESAAAPANFVVGTIRIEIVANNHERTSWTVGHLKIEFEWEPRRIQVFANIFCLGNDDLLTLATRRRRRRSASLLSTILVLRKTRGRVRRQAPDHKERIR